MGSHYQTVGQWGTLSHARWASFPVAVAGRRFPGERQCRERERERERSGAAGREREKCAETARNEKQQHPRTAQ